jgi:metal-sulfur cluster biosynthetic enzyme
MNGSEQGQAEGAGSKTGSLEPTSFVLEIWDALDSISDPCHALSGHELSIIDLGLINRVTPVGDDVEIGLTLTEVGCTFGFRIIEQIEALKSAFPEVGAFRVVVEPLPMWTPSRLSERAKNHYASTRLEFGPRA